MTRLSTPQPRAATASPGSTARARVQYGVDRVAHWLTRHSIPALRVSLGLVFLLFGALKLVPGASPAAELVTATVAKLSFGLVSGHPALLLTATVECFIGITLLTGRMLRLGLLVLAGAMVGIMSPLVLSFPELFPGEATLEAQYILKNVVLIAAALVVTAHTLGARLVTDRPVTASDSNGCSGRS